MEIEQQKDKNKIVIRIHTKNVLTSRLLINGFIFYF